MELNEKQQEMLDKFKWNDEDEGGVRIEGDGLVNEIEECAGKILAIIKNSLTKESYNGEEVIIPVPTSTHDLLGRLLASDVDPESQAAVLENLCHVTFSKAWVACDKEQIEQKINEQVIPVDKTLKHRHAMENLWLHINLDEEDCPIVDFTSDADANKNLNDLMGLGLPEDHVREQASIQGRDEEAELLQVEITLKLENNPDYDPSYDPGRSVEEGTVIETERGATFKNS